MVTMAEEMELSDYCSESGLPMPLQLSILLKLGKFLRARTQRKDGTLNRRLSDLLDFKAHAQGTPVRGVSSKDIVIDAETGVWVRIYIPHGESKSGKKASSSEINSTAVERMPIIFYFHGGGFATLCANFTYYDSFCRNLCRKCQTLVISVDYRRAPEHRYPIAYDDCFSALKWLQTQSKDHIPPNADLSRCFLMGDSAGGNIVHHVGCRAATVDLSPVKVIGNMLLFPFFGGEERTPSELRLVNAPMVTTKNADWSWKTFLPKDANRDHHAANVFGPNAPDISNLSLPASIVSVGEYDSLKDWQIRYVQSLKKIGKEVQLLYYKGGIHCFHVFSRYQPAPQLLTYMDEFVRARCTICTEAARSA